MRRRRAGVVGVAATLLLAPTAAMGQAPADAIRVGGPSTPGEAKVAIVASARPRVGQTFTVTSQSGATVHSGVLEPAEGSPSPWAHAARAVLTAVTAPGTYVIRAADVVSPPWTVDPSADRTILDGLLRVFAVNADGSEPNPVFGPSHLNDASAPIVGGPTDGGTVDVAGGWRDAGDAIKFTITTATASALLDYAALLDPPDAEKLRAAADVGIRWLRKAHPAGSQTFIAQVGDTTDHGAGFRDFATDDSSSNPALAHRKAYGDAGSGALGAGAAALALAASRPSAPADQRQQLLDLAREWYTRGKAVSAPGPELGGFRQPGDPAMGFYTDWQGFMALGAAALYRATGTESYLDDAKGFLAAVDFGQSFSPYFTVGPLAAADLCGGVGRPAVPRADARDQACGALKQATDATASANALTAFGTPGGFYFGWVQGHTGNAAIAAAADRAGVTPGGLALAAGARDYLLGRNPWGASFVVGPAAHAAHNPYHPLFLKGDRVQLGTGLVVGGPAVASQFPDFGITPDPNDRFAPFDPTYDTWYYQGKVIYEDQPDNYITSEVGLAYSASAVLLLAELAAASPDTPAAPPPPPAPGPGASPPPPDRNPPGVALRLRRQKLAAALRNGYRTSFVTTEPGRAVAQVLARGRQARRLSKRSRRVVVARGARTLTAAGAATVVARFTPKARRTFKRSRRLPLFVRVTMTDRSGNRTVKSRAIILS